MTKLLLWAFIKNRDDVQNPAVRRQYGLLSGAVGIVLNLLLTAGKLAAGLAASSIAVMADAFNNLTDGRRPTRGTPSATDGWSTCPGWWSPC